MDIVIEYAGIPIVFILIGLLEVFKKTGLNKKYVPITSLILGLGIGIALYGGDLIEGVVKGLYIGLSAVGLYSGTKNTMEKEK